MQTTPNQKLLEWIRKFRVDLTPEGTITRIELHHSIEGGMGERLATFEMADRDEDEDPDDLAQEIWNECEEDASVRPTGSIERYVVQAFRGDTREPDEQKAFTVTGRLTTALTGNGSEPPTLLGQTAAEMRRTNDLHALVVRMCEATAGSAAIQLQREREENQRLREVGFKYEQLRQELLDRSLDRELTRKDAEASAQQLQTIFGTLMQLAPIVLTRLLTPAGPPSAALPLQPAPPPPANAGAPQPRSPDGSTRQSPERPEAPRNTVPEAPRNTVPSVPLSAVAPQLERDQAVANLLGSVSPDQLRGLVATFTPEQTQAFLTIYGSFREHPPTPVPSAAGHAPTAESSPHPPEGERPHDSN